MDRCPHEPVESDPEGQARVAAFRQAFEQLGWKEGGNIRIDIRWGEDKMDLERKYAAELVALAPDVILASGTMGVTAVQALSRTLPIVFAAVADPVGAGFVESMVRPISSSCNRALTISVFSGLSSNAPPIFRLLLIDCGGVISASLFLTQ